MALVLGLVVDVGLAVDDGAEVAIGVRVPPDGGLMGCAIGLGKVLGIALGESAGITLAEPVGETGSDVGTCSAVTGGGARIETAEVCPVCAAPEPSRPLSISLLLLNKKIVPNATSAQTAAAPMKTAFCEVAAAFSLCVIAAI